jgi:Mg2+/Co2+ transporter CorC
MRFPIVFVSAEEVDEYIKHLVTYKTVYEKIVEEEIDEDLNEEDIKVLLNTLPVSDFSIKGLHTIIFLDDRANSKLLKPNSIFVPY